jgi:hypothetical protein
MRKGCLPPQRRALSAALPSIDALPNRCLKTDRWQGYLPAFSVAGLCHHRNLLGWWPWHILLLALIAARNPKAVQNCETCATRPLTANPVREPISIGI